MLGRVRKREGSNCRKDEEEIEWEGESVCVVRKLTAHAIQNKTEKTTTSYRASIGLHTGLLVQY